MGTEIRATANTAEEKNRFIMVPRSDGMPFGLAPTQQQQGK
jgi:hypothetical protein